MRSRTETERAAWIGKWGSLDWETGWPWAGCSGFLTAIGSAPGCFVSVLLTNDGKHIEEYYDIVGDPPYRHGRETFFSH